ncbi:MAG: hypothetical protein IPL08_21095 [Saprospiraceae bacterium]|nr:hypothetical protein [Saprospiraceae bacterium]
MAQHTAPTVRCTVTSITTCAYFSENSSVTGLTIGQTYKIVNSWSTIVTDGFGVYTSNVGGTAPLAWVSGTASPLSLTFVATTTSVYIQAFATGCTSPASTCNTRTVECISCAPPASSTTQPLTTAVTGGTLNNQVLRLNAPVCGQTVTQIDFATTGSTNPTTDIANAKVFYTTSTTFSSTTQFGSTVVAPNGTFSVTGSQAVAATGYFWLTYDLNCGAVGANVIDAECNSFVANGSTITLALHPNPSGTRSITAATTTISTNQPSSAAVVARYR